MRNDPKSNYTIASVLAAISQTAATVNSASVDHSEAGAVSFLIDAGTFGASATLDAKTQYSDDDSSWTDYPANDEAKNDDAITQMVAAGEALLHVPNPRGRYTRVVVTVAVAAVVFGVSSFLGPLRHVST